ncbi:glycerol-3-phosphate dehydrogenase [Robiginitomaculum antarcticum]|uniref:glycerol-3-phosphate dehydrogenase n=1 Tax=Robiginitomaculum antarcticum TaxID=437507 RepID=UPI00037F7452|nr:glycerol-3-phosphate dehydrogenase [Robiginitomaculum antarcticum]
MTHKLSPIDDIQDILVIGGGVNGCGIANDAAGRGLSVTLCEMGDLAGATSSNSSKLIHGGLRYLEHMEFRLVREALREREVMLRKAPHIVWPLRIVLPHHDELRPAWMLRLGLFIYDNLGGRKTLPGTKTRNLLKEPHLSILKDNMTKGFEFSDCWVDDARLVVLNAVQAARSGANILPRVKCSALSRGADGMWTAVLDGQAPHASGQITIRARAVVNAAGIAVDEILETALPGRQEDHLRLIKGSHIVTRKLYEGDHLYMFQNADDRIIFCIPYENDYTLIGTTDAPYDPADGPPKISDSERDYLIGAANEYLKTPISVSDIAWDYAGVRPLYDNKKDDASEVTRDYVFDLEGSDTEAPILSIFGGKITTYRELSEHALQKLSKFFPDAGGDWTEHAVLPGGDIPGGDFERFEVQMQRHYKWIDKTLLHRLLRCYGTLIHDVLENCQGQNDMGKHFGAGLYEREVEYLIDNEWAMSANDVLWRRTKRGLHMSEAERDALAAWFEDRA